SGSGDGFPGIFCKRLIYFDFFVATLRQAVRPSSPIWRAAWRGDRATHIVCVHRARAPYLPMRTEGLEVRQCRVSAIMAVSSAKCNTLPSGKVL
ncbi:hypothetical protein, partial [Thiomonas sp.]